MKINSNKLLQKQIVLIFIILFSFYSKLNAQTSISGIVNLYSAVTSISQPACAPCDVACVHTITVTNGSLFAVGDRALIIQMKGATINTANSAGSGNVTAINNAGNYEFFEVGSIAGNVITPRYPLIRSYTVTGKVQVVRIPQFADDVAITGTLRALDWDEAAGIGGVVAIEAKKVIMSAGIDVLGQGYAGIQMGVNGVPDNCTINPTTVFNVNNGTNSTFTKGDGIVLDDPNTNRGRAPRANGGGAGISGDSGGGGGSNYGAGGEGGKRWCDVDGANAGGIGGFALTSFLAQDKVFLGGAGGPGFVTTGNPSTAADGGGIVIIFADTIVGNNQTIDARGTAPVAVNPVGAPDGGGGGGAGGTVVLKTKVFVGNLTVNASGGNGQDLNTDIDHGPGGGGGGGVLLYSLAAIPPGVTFIANAGQGGVMLPAAVSIADRNGSQDGTVGGSISLYVPIQNPNYEGNIDKDVIPVACDIDDDNDAIPDIVEAYNGDHDNDGLYNYEDADFCTVFFQGVNGWNCAQGLPDPSGDLDGDLIPNFRDANFPGCGTLVSGGICSNYDKDGDGNPNHLDLDSDNDGVSDLVEARGVDTNGDGQIDVTTDTDGDGLANSYDNNDNDGPTGSSPCAGIPNCLQVASTSILFDGDANGSKELDPDLDGDRLPNYLDLDSDNDGITDVREANGLDANNDGRADAFVDIDNDGYNDVYDGVFENCTTTGSYSITPSFTAYATSHGPGNTGITNPNDALGVPLAADYAELFDSGDIFTLQISNTVSTGGIITLYLTNESGSNAANSSLTFSTNGTTFTNATVFNVPAGATFQTFNITVPINTVAIRMTRTNGTNIRFHGLSYVVPQVINSTIVRTCVTANGSPIVFTGADTNSDGQPNSYVSGNSDSDINPNFIDIDADNDGIVDNSEAQATATYIAPGTGDSDNDGLLNAYDFTSGGTAIIPVNTDGADNADYLDLDSDNDGSNDPIEGWDTDGNGVANTLSLGTDADRDGLDDAYDVNDALTNPTNGTTPSSYPDVLLAGGDRDWRDCRRTIALGTVTNPTTCGGTNGSIQITGLAISTTYTIDYVDDGTPVSVSLSSNASGVITISGLNAGSYTNIRATRSGCSSNTLSGPVTLANPPNTAAAPSSSPTLCRNSALTSITIATTGATGISNSGVSGANGLPAGVSATWAANVITISGTPTASGTFNYSIPLTGGCGTVNATGTIIVTATNTAAAPSSSPTLCRNSALTSITIATTGATGISNSGVSGANGLPAGVSATWAANVITISGTPTASGTFNYSIPLTGGCGTVNATGTIIVTATNI
jgi:hypothetical protein